MTSASSGTGKQEQRRHARLATSQTAHVRFGEGEAIPAEIRDYCQTGLYVAFPGAHTPDAAIPALLGDSVQVVFAVDAVSMGPATNKLSLIDEAAFEDCLSLSAVIKQIEAGIAILLGEFEQRYGRLIGILRLAQSGWAAQPSGE